MEAGPLNANRYCYRYLSAYTYKDSDKMYKGYARMTVHQHIQYAAVFKFVTYSGKKVLQIKKNDDSKTVNWYLSIPPHARRDNTSSYVAVTSDISKAASVSMKPAVKIDECEP